MHTLGACGDREVQALLINTTPIWITCIETRTLVVIAISETFINVEVFERALDGAWIPEFTFSSSYFRDKLQDSVVSFRW
jgi:hypothetical protein